MTAAGRRTGRRSSVRAGRGVQRPVQVAAERRPRSRVGGSGQGPNDDAGRRQDRRSSRGASWARSRRRHPVPHHAAADRLAHDQADPAAPALRVLGQQVHTLPTAAAPARPATVGDRREVCGAATGGVPRASTGARSAQADSSLRPLRRRADRMARPARVRIRSRKPWVLARRRLFGWKVRLLTVWLHHNLRCLAAGIPGRQAQSVGRATSGGLRSPRLWTTTVDLNGTDRPRLGSDRLQISGAPAVAGSNQRQSTVRSHPGQVEPTQSPLRGTSNLESSALLGHVERCDRLTATRPDSWRLAGPIVSRRARC